MDPDWFRNSRCKNIYSIGGFHKVTIQSTKKKEKPKIETMKNANCVTGKTRVKNRDKVYIISFLQK